MHQRGHNKNPRDESNFHFCKLDKKNKNKEQKMESTLGYIENLSIIINSLNHF